MGPAQPPAPGDKSVKTLKTTDRCKKDKTRPRGPKSLPTGPSGKPKEGSDVIKDKRMAPPLDIKLPHPRSAKMQSERLTSQDTGTEMEPTHPFREALERNKLGSSPAKEDFDPCVTNKYTQNYAPDLAMQFCSDTAPSLGLHAQDGVKPLADEPVIGQHFVIGAECALKAINEKEAAIEAAFDNFQISKSEYAILAGFNEALMRSGTGYLPEIHVFCSVDIGLGSESLVIKLGKVLSPSPGVLFTPSSMYQIPVFKDDSTLLSWDELVFSRTERYVGICSAVTPTSIQVVSCPQGSCSNGRTSAPAGLVSESRSSNSDRRDTDGESNGEGGDEKSEDRKGDDGNSGGENPDDPAEDSLTSSIPVVSFDAQVKVYAITTGTGTSSPKVFQELQVNGRLIIQSHPPRIKPKQLPKSCVEFKKLKFQGRRAIPTTGYEQVHARVVIDTKEELTRVEAIKPCRTPAVGLESTETTTRKSESVLGFSNSAGFGWPCLKAVFSGHLGTESFSCMETRNFGSRITQGDSYGGAWWGFNIDDPHAQEAGIELLDTLPSVEFEFLGKNASPPARLHVEVASCWSLIPKNENRHSWLQALVGQAKPRALSYSNLCQIVQLEVPSTLLEDSEYMSLTHVTQTGCHTDVKLEGSHPVHVTPSIVFLEESVAPDTGITQGIGSSSMPRTLSRGPKNDPQRASRG